PPLAQGTLGDRSDRRGRCVALVALTRTRRRCGPRRRPGRSSPHAGSSASWRSSCSSGRSGSATRCRLHCSSSAPALREQPADRPGRRLRHWSHRCGSLAGARGYLCRRARRPDRSSVSACRDRRADRHGSVGQPAEGGYAKESGEAASFSDTLQTRGAQAFGPPGSSAAHKRRGGDVRPQYSRPERYRRFALATAAEFELRRTYVTLDPHADDMTVVLVVIGVVAIVVLVVAAASIHILKQYERAVKFRLGRVGDGAFGPGLVVIIPLIDRINRVSLRIVTMPIQSQGIITRDNVSVDVSAVAYYKVVDAVRAVVAIENVASAIDQIAQTTLRAVVGRHTLDETLSDTEELNKSIREILDVQT